jgi:rsbT co-antagonist protein RsbR
MATGRPATVETTGIRDNGSVSFARIRAFPVLNAEGTPTGFIEVVEDIAELKQAEEARQESEERFRLLVEYAADAFFLHDADTRILEVNRRACESLGYTREELLGLSVQDFDPALDSGARDRWKRLVPGEPETVERVHARKDGTTFPVEVRLGAIQSGEQRLFLALVRDITERKRAEAEVQKAYADVKRQVEEQTAELKREVAERERLQQEIIEAQKQALREISTPIIPVMERIIVMPLIGGIDTLRARDITRALLAGIQQHKAKVVIIDITGVPIVDSGVASYLNKTIQAARLKGARTIITGISDAVAETIVDLGIDWSGIETLADLRTGLLVALNSLGIELAK